MTALNHCQTPGHTGRPDAAIRRVIGAGVFLLATALASCSRDTPPATPPTDATSATSTLPNPANPNDTSGNQTTGATATSLGTELFTRHCAACHGPRGDGLGLAATFLFPKPRDFRSGRFRLVSTANKVPTRDDLMAVLARGMPGSSMPPWAHLPLPEREAIVDEVLRIRREGAREIYTRILKEGDELTDQEIASAEVQQDIQAYVDKFTTPGETTVVPSFGEPTAEGLAAAKQVYAKFGCLQCHGAEGKGDGVQKMIDEEKLPTAPRDFTAGIFKGGHDAASLYRRIAYGMPGTPMPGSQQMTPEQMVELVHYIRNMSTEEQRQRAVLKRESIVASRVAALPVSPDDAAWNRLPGAVLRTMPLWWRNDADPGLEVKAVHDGQSLAIRLSWHDVSPNQSAVRPDEFEDMVAVQFCPVSNESFLGMGAGNSLVDVWQWRAGTPNTGAEDQLMDEYPFDTEVYRKLAGGQPLPDFVTARAAGNPLARREHSAANLSAQGVGTTTFRPAVSQLVSATSLWSNAQWNVVLVRPLAVPADGGLPLSAGTTYSAAYAVWDGAARERGGQKVISLWNDLRLE